MGWAVRSALGRSGGLWQRVTEGSLSHKAALPPSFGLSDDDHFSQAMAISRHPPPMEQETVLDEDLESPPIYPE